jgi:hypothetical protein
MQMAEETTGKSEMGEDLLLTFLAQTKEGKYAVIDERYLSNIRMEAQAMIIDDMEYYCSTG